GSTATVIPIKNIVRMERVSLGRRNIRGDLRRSGSYGTERRIVVGALTKGEPVAVITDNSAARGKREGSSASWGGQFVSSFASLSSSGEVATSLRAGVCLSSSGSLAKSTAICRASSTIRKPVCPGGFG